MFAKTDYINALNRTARNLRINPLWLDVIILVESGRDPQATNPKGGAFGLIQFMPDTLRDLGITKRDVQLADAERHFWYVELYFEEQFRNFKIDPAKHLKEAADLYTVVFYPKHTTRAGGLDIRKQPNPGKYDPYEMNTGLDKNKDGKIDKADLRAHLKAKIADSAAYLGVAAPPAAPSRTTSSTASRTQTTDQGSGQSWGWIIATLAAIGLLFLIPAETKSPTPTET